MRHVILLAILAAILLLLLATVAHTPRARLNIVQVSAALFYILVVVRQSAVSPSKTVESEFPGKRGLLLSLSILIGAVVWARMVPLYFIADDFEHLMLSRQPSMQTLWALTIHGQQGAFLRPVGFATIFIDHHVWGGWPNGYHMTNLAFHLTTVAGLFFLCRELRFGATVAGIAAMMFAVLPIETEAVSWMGARFDLVSACFVFWGAFFYVSYRRCGTKVRYLAALACFILGALSKENAYVFPLMLVAAECFVLPQRHFRPLIAFFLAAPVLFAYRWITLGGIGGYVDAQGQPMAFHAGFKMMEGLFLRAPAMLLIGLNWVQPPAAVAIELAAASAAAVLVLAVFCKAGSIGWKRMCFCFTWMLLPLIPAHPFLLTTPDLKTTRIFYGAAAGIAMLLALLLDGVYPRRVRYAMAGLLIGLFSLGVLHNVNAWRSTARLEARFLSEIKALTPAPPPDAEFVFHDMPTTVRGVYFLEAGLRDSIRMTLGRDDVTARRVADPPRSGDRREIPPQIHVQWVGRQDALITPLSR
jgi:hypothetical protein